MSLLLARVGGGGGGINYTLSGLNGTYTITGQSATVKRTYSLNGSSGNYTITGQNTNVKRGYNASGSNGTYTITGQSATVKRGYSLSGNNGTYTITGQSAQVTRGYLASGLNGTYVITGQLANAVYTPGTGAIAYTLQGLNGNYLINGQAANADYFSPNQNQIISSGGFISSLAYNKKKREERLQHYRDLGVLEENIEKVSDIVEKVVNQPIKSKNKPSTDAQERLLRNELKQADIRYRKLYLEALYHELLIQQQEQEEEEILMLFMAA